MKTLKSIIQQEEMKELEKTGEARKLSFGLPLNNDNIYIIKDRVYLKDYKGCYVWIFKN